MNDVTAFPNGNNVTQGQFESSPGMSLRDYFAAKNIPRENWVFPDESAEKCYKVADAMLKARGMKVEHLPQHTEHKSNVPMYAGGAEGAPYLDSMG